LSRARPGSRTYSAPGGARGLEVVPLARSGTPWHEWSGTVHEEVGRSDTGPDSLSDSGATDGRAPGASPGHGRRPGRRRRYERSGREGVSGGSFRHRLARRRVFAAVWNWDEDDRHRGVRDAFGAHGPGDCPGQAAPLRVPHDQDIGIPCRLDKHASAVPVDDGSGDGRCRVHALEGTDDGLVLDRGGTRVCFVQYRCRVVVGVGRGHRPGCDDFCTYPSTKGLLEREADGMHRTLRAVGADNHDALPVACASLVHRSSSDRCLQCVCRAEAAHRVQMPSGLGLGPFWVRHRMMATGQPAWATRLAPTEPSSMPANAPRPRAPTTMRAASCDACLSAARGSSIDISMSTVRPE